MKHYLALLRLQLNVLYGFSEMRSAARNNPKELFKKLGILLVVLLALVQILAVYSIFLFSVFSVSGWLHAPGLVLTLASVGAGMVVFVFGIFTILTVMFFAKDSEMLLSLPVSQTAIFSTKFTMVLLREYPLVLFLMVPAVLIYGIFTGASFLYYCLALLAVLLLPVIPLAVSALLSMLLMRLVARIRHRDMMVTVGSLLLFLVIFIGQMLFSRAVSSSGGQAMLETFTRSGGLIDAAGRAYPPALWVTSMLAGHGIEAFAGFALLLAVSAAALAVVLFLSRFIYRKGLQSQFETLRKKHTAAYRIGASSPVLALFKNEWLSIIRTPIYATNILVGILVVPIVLVMPLFSGGKDGTLELMRMTAGLDSRAVMLISAGILMLFSALNPAPSTSLSREGRCLWIMKTIPLPPATQILGKFWCGYSISVLIAAAGAAVLIAGYHMRALPVLLGMLLALVYAAVATALSLLVDVIRPKLIWSNPQEAVKQNMNSLAAMLISVILIGVFAALAALLYFLQLPYPLLFAVLLAAFGACAFAGLQILFSVFDRRFYRMSV